MGIYTARDIEIDFSGELKVDSRGDIKLLSPIDTQKNLVNFWLRTDFGEYSPETSVGCNIGAFMGLSNTKEVLANLEESVESTLRTELFTPQDVIVHAVPFDYNEALVVVEFAGTYLNTSGRFEDIQPQKIAYAFPYIEGTITPLTVGV